MKRLYALALLVAMFAGACVPAGAQAPEEPDTATPTQDATSTATIVWFPPTATPTPVPTQEMIPTPEQHPGVGDVSLEDDFSVEGPWSTGKGEGGSVAYGRNELTIAISKPKAALYSLRSGTGLADFYLEMTANPSLCKGSDAYGLLVRAENSKDTYRYAINCSGQIRLERVKNSQLVILQDWMTSGQVPPGSPLTVRLGVWAVQNELRFFINDYYQFRVRDPVFPAGGVGVFARSGGENAVTVSFSNLIVRDVDYQLPTGAPASPTPVKKATRKAGTVTITPVFSRP